MPSDRELSGLHDSSIDEVVQALRSVCLSNSRIIIL